MVRSILPGPHVVFVVLAVFGLVACASFLFERVYPSGRGFNSCRQTKLTTNTTDNNTVAPYRAATTLTANSSTSEATLSSILEAAAMPNKTVIIAPLNGAWAAPGSLFDLFFESFRIGIGTKPLLRHLVVVAVDPLAYARCNLMHPHCFFLKTPGVDFSEEEAYMTDGYLKLVWRKIDFLGTVLELGYSFVCTDVDIMWLRDPLPDLQLAEGDAADFTVSCDYYVGNASDLGNSANSGFQYVKANYRSTAFYRYWYSARELHPGTKTQDVFDVITTDPFTKELGIRFRFLDTDYFGNLCDIKDKDPSRFKTMHANCCVGIQNKARILRIVLDDWANFTTVTGLLNPQSIGNYTSSTNFAWRLPTIEQCE